MAWLLRILAAFPLPVLHFLGWWIYFLAFHVVRWRVPLARANLDAAFPEKSGAARRRILRDCYRNLAAALMEGIWGYGATGAALTAPAYEPTAKFPVRVENGQIQVRDDRWD